jgi:predicted amidophosphoribosyltransferase
MPPWIAHIGACLNNYFTSFLHLLYPHICLQCGTDQLEDQQVICTSCESQLPFTQFHQIKDSPVEKIFWGRVPIEHAIAVLFFTKESCVQQIIFELKYQQNKKAG